jgi:general secretion pathway protein G
MGYDENESRMHPFVEPLRPRTEEGGEGGFTLIELLIVIVVLGILVAIVVFAVQRLTSSGAESSCSTDWKTVQTALEAYKAEMGAYPHGGGVTDTAPAIPPALTVGSPPGGTNATAVLLTGSDVGGGLDSNNNPTENKGSSTGRPAGPWLKDVPANPDHYSIYVANDGTGTIVVLDRNGTVSGPAGGTGGNGVSDCDKVP